MLLKLRIVALVLMTQVAAPTASMAQTPPQAPASKVPQGGVPVNSGSPALPSGAEALPSPADMLARIHLLEKRLADIEDRKRGAAPKPATKAAASAPPPAKPLDAPQNTTVLAKSAVASDTQRSPQTSAQQATPSPATPSEASVQSSFIFRDQAPTLAPSKTEISYDGSYTRNVRAGASPIIQYDRVFAGTLEARFGLASGYEIGAALPYFQSTRQTRGPISVDEDIDSIGDARFQVAKQVFAPTALLPGMTLSFGVEAPTGATRYTTVNRIVALQESAVARCPTAGCTVDPRDQSPFSPFLPSIASRGHWTGSTNAQFFKTFDPIVLFFGAGVTYAAPREFDGNTFQPGLRFSYNAGLSLALSEHTTLGFQYSGTLEQKFKATIRGYSDGKTRTFVDPASETARARMVIIQRLGDGLYIEPSLTYGLTDDTPDVTLGLALRKRL